MSDLSDELKRLRLARKWTQTDLAEELGLTKPDSAGKNQVSRWETGQPPGIENVRRLQEVFEIEDNRLVNLWIKFQTGD